MGYGYPPPGYRPSCEAVTSGPFQGAARGAAGGALIRAVRAMPGAAPAMGPVWALFRNAARRVRRAVREPALKVRQGTSGPQCKRCLAALALACCSAHAHSDGLLHRRPTAAAPPRRGVTFRGAGRPGGGMSNACAAPTCWAPHMTTVAAAAMFYGYWPPRQASTSWMSARSRGISVAASR